MKFKFKRLSGCARAAIRATARSAGHDLFSAENSVQIILTDIGLKIPKNHCGRICSRFSSALKHTSDGAKLSILIFQEKFTLHFLTFSINFIKFKLAIELFILFLKRFLYPSLKKCMSLTI